MEQFTIPLKAFDLELLPPGARTPGSTEFRDAVDAFFQRQFLELGAKGVVTITPDHVSVAWVTAGFDPVEAAIAKLKRGQFREGAQLLDLIRARRPDSPEVLYNLGLALSELGEVQRAIEILSHLVKVEPRHVHGLVALGVALGRDGNNSAAAETLSEAVELAPTDVWAQKNLGGILFRLGRLDEARVRLETAVRLAPNDAQAWLLLGDICLSLHDTQAGRTALQRARTLDSRGPIRERAETLLNRLTHSELPRNAEGINERALEAMISALRRLRGLPAEAAHQLTFRAALIGQKGLNLLNDQPIHQLEGLDAPLSGLELACLIHAGLQLASPGADSGLPLTREFEAAKQQLGSESN